MHLYRAPGIFAVCPVHKNIAYRDGGGVQHEHVPVDARQRSVVVGIQGPDKAYQVRPEILVYAPVPVFVGTGEGRMVHDPFDAGVVQLVLVRPRAETGVAQPFPSGQLPIEPMRELAPAVQPAGPIIAIVAVDTFLELVTVGQREYLCENVFTCIHNLGFCQSYSSIQIKISKNVPYIPDLLSF